MTTLAEVEQAIKDGRNIIDHYKYWKNEVILADLDSKRHNFSILCWNTGYDFNISNIIRSGNAFLAKEVILFQRKKFDKRGCVGTQHYTRFKHFKQIDNLTEWLNSLTQRPKIIAVENVPQAKSITTFQWPKEHVIMMFGQESLTLPQELLDLADDTVYIPMYGSVRSLNVGNAATIAMYDYVSKL